MLPKERASGSKFGHHYFFLWQISSRTDIGVTHTALDADDCVCEHLIFRTDGKIPSGQ